jgi:hypothetical protein
VIIARQFLGQYRAFAADLRGKLSDRKSKEIAGEAKAKWKRV